MKIQINTDHNIKGTDGLIKHLSSELENAFIRISDHITRIEVHLSDENGSKNSNNDKRCVMEARLDKRQPIAVTHHAATIEQAVTGAAGKLVKLIESTLERKENQRTHRTKVLQPGQIVSE